MISRSSNIGFIGAGNMATALIEGLLGTGSPAENLWASDTSSGRLQSLSTKGIKVTDDNAELVRHCETLILAVKPQVMPAVVQALAGTLKENDSLLISIAAGIPLASLQAWSHPAQRIVRCMPNTPALVQLGASALCANTNTSAEDRTRATAILDAVGISCWLDSEQQMDAVTALSGSGPAYFFLLIEAMQQAGVELGLSEEVAASLCLQTALGTATLACRSEESVSELRQRVTSPGGTTEAAIQSFEHSKLRSIVLEAMQQAALRSAQLAQTQI